MVALLAVALAGPVDGASASGLAWSSPIHLTQSGGYDQILGVSCPTVSQCAAIDNLGQIVTFDPGSPGSAQLTPVPVYPTGSETGVQCPSATQCTVVEGDTEFTFDPATPGTQTSATVGTKGAFYYLACPTSTLCAAEDQGSPGGIVTFDPQTGAVIGSRVTPETTGLDNALACASASMCTVDDYNGNEVTFDPSTGTIVSNTKVVTSGGLGALSCPATTLCTASNGSKVVSFNPSTGATVSGPTAIGGFSALSCASATQCTGVTNDAEVTFDPSTESVATGPTAIDTATAIDGTTTSLTRVSCPTTSQCTAVDYIGNAVTFNPISVGTPTPTLVDGTTSLNGVACPSATQCTAIDTIGRVATFNPLSPGNPTPVLVDPGPNFLDNPPGLSSIACPSVSQCTLVDMNGNAVTFDPASPASTAKSTSVDFYSLDNVACPTTTQCTAVDYAGGEVTFNPTSPGTPSPDPVDPSGDTLVSLACPTASQCTTLDTGTGDEITFDPNTPSGTPSVVQIYQGYNLSALDCPSATMCVAVDYQSYLTFNPQAPPSTLPALTPIDPVNQSLVGLACPSVSECVATDYNGAAVVGDPSGTAAWSVDQIAEHPLLGAGCFNAGACVTVDDLGNAYVGITAPSATSAPSIAGRPIAGQTLTEGHGTWTLAPDSYAYQWQRCDTSGNGCTPISGATGQTYTLTGADVGHTIRVDETASNRAGAGTPSRSAATAVVTGLPANVSPPHPQRPGRPGPDAHRGPRRVVERGHRLLLQVDALRRRRERLHGDHRRHQPDLHARERRSLPHHPRARDRQQRRRRQRPGQLTTVRRRDRRYAGRFRLPPHEPRLRGLALLHAADRDRRPPPPGHHLQVHPQRGRDCQDRHLPAGSRPPPPHSHRPPRHADPHQPPRRQQRRLHRPHRLQGIEARPLPGDADGDHRRQEVEAPHRLLPDRREVGQRAGRALGGGGGSPPSLAAPAQGTAPR